MKKQLLILILGGTIFSTNPVFAMDSELSLDSEELKRKPRFTQTQYYKDDWTIKSPVTGRYDSYFFNLDHTPQTFTTYAKNYIQERDKFPNTLYEHLGKQVYHFECDVLTDYVELVKEKYSDWDKNEQESCKEFLVNYSHWSSVERAMNKPAASNGV